MVHKPPLGQHWLDHKPSLRAMVTAVDLRSGETVLEIGTGLGYLTDELIKTGAGVISLEYDASLYEKALNKYGSEGVGDLTLTNADVRQFDWRTLPRPYKICANIPYYLSANLLRQLTEISAKPLVTALLLAQEVALKLVQVKKKSLLAVLVQSHYEVELGLIVDRELFRPPPKVTSQIVILKLKPAFKDCSGDDWPKLVRLFKAGFSSQRKQLGVNLRHLLHLSSPDLEDIFSDLDISHHQRAEELTHKQWWQLFLKIQHRL